MYLAGKDIYLQMVKRTYCLKNCQFSRGATGRKGRFPRGLGQVVDYRIPR